MTQQLVVVVVVLLCCVVLRPTPKPTVYGLRTEQIRRKHSQRLAHAQMVSRNRP